MLETVQALSRFPLRAQRNINGELFCESIELGSLKSGNNTNNKKLNYCSPFNYRTFLQEALIKLLTQNSVAIRILL